MAAPTLPVRLSPRTAAASVVAKIAARTGRPFRDRDELQREMPRLLAAMSRLGNPRPPQPNEYCYAMGQSIKASDVPTTVSASEIDLIIDHPDERLAMTLLRELPHGYLTYQTWLVQQGLRRPNEPVNRLAPELAALQARVWAGCVARADRDLDEQGVEMTPLLDLLLQQAEGAQFMAAREGHRLPLGALANFDPELPRLAGYLREQSDARDVERLMGFRSRLVRRTVFANAQALRAPDVVLDLLRRLDNEAVRLIMSNPAISPEAVEVFTEWGLFHVARGEASSTVQEIFRGLAAGGHRLNPVQLRRLHLMLKASTQPSVRDAMAVIPDAVQDPTLYALLSSTGVEKRLATLALSAEGERWIELVGRLSKSGSLLPVLSGTDVSQLQGVSRTALLPLMQHANRDVRLQAMRLASGVSDAPTPTAPSRS